MKLRRLLLVCALAPAVAHANDSLQLLANWQVDPNGTLGECDGLSFTPDGKALAVSDNLATVRLYDVQSLPSRPLIRTFVHANVPFIGRQNPAGEINAVHFTPNGAWMLTGIDAFGTKVWNVSNGANSTQLDNGSNSDGGAFSPDGAWIANAANNVLRVRPFFGASGTAGAVVLSSAHNTSGEVNSIGWTSDSRYVVSAGLKIVKVHDRVDNWALERDIANTDAVSAADRNPGQPSITFNGSVKSVSVSPDNALIAIGARDERARIFNLATGAIVKSNLKHNGNRTALANDDQDSNVAVEAVAWSAEGNYLFTSGLIDGVMRVWRRADWSLVGWAQAQAANRAIEFIDVSSDNRVAVGGDEGWVYVYRFTPPAVLNPIQQASAGAHVSIEAESADTRLRQGNHRWDLTSSGTASGTGSNTVTAVPVASQHNGGIKDTNFQTWNPVVDSPKLDYRVNFKETGTFYVWVRGLGPDDGNSVHVGLDGTPSANAEKVQFGGSGTTTWMWVGTNRSGARATINVGTTGNHTLNVWMREDGVAIDKIVLTKSSTFTPTGTGPAASSR